MSAHWKIPEQGVDLRSDPEKKEEEYQYLFRQEFMDTRSTRDAEAKIARV